MFQKVLQFIFGSKFERDLKRLTPIVAEINSFDPEIQKLSNEELKNQYIVVTLRLLKLSTGSITWQEEKKFLKVSKNATFGW